jgi:hypothetical protein
VLVLLEDGPDGGTSLRYDADAVVGGMIGGVGQRMLTGVSKKMADEFFGNVDSLLAGIPAAPGAAGLRAAGAPPYHPPSSVGLPPGPTTVGAPAALRPEPGQVFTAPAAAAAPAQPSFVVGVVVGAASALAGVVVGAWIAGRRRR